MPVSHLLSARSPLVSLINNPSDPSELGEWTAQCRSGFDGLGRSHIRWQLRPCTPCPRKSSRARACIYIYVYSLDPCSHLRLTQLSAGVSTAIRGSPSRMPDGGWIAFCVIFPLTIHQSGALVNALKRKRFSVKHEQHKNKPKYGKTWDIVCNRVVSDRGSLPSLILYYLFVSVFSSAACLPGLRHLRSRTSVIKSWLSSSKTTATSSTAATMETKMASLGNYQPSSLSRYTYHLVVQVHFISIVLNRGYSLKGI